MRCYAIVLALLMLAIATGCSSDAANKLEASGEPEIRRIGAVGIEITFPREVRLERIRILERDETICDMPTAGSRRRYFVPLSSRRRRGDRIEFISAGRKQTKQFNLPLMRDLGLIPASIEAPAGQDPVPLESPVRVGEPQEVYVLVGPDRRISLALNAETQREQAYEFEWVLEPPEGAQLSFDSSNWQMVEKKWTCAGKFVIALQNARETVSIAFPPQMDQATMKVTFRQNLATSVGSDKKIEQSVTVYFRTTSIDELRLAVAAGKLEFPADPRGTVLSERATDEVRLPNPIWSKLLGSLQPAERVHDRYAENAWQAVPLTNRTKYPLNLAIESFVTTARGDKPLLNFAPPAWKAPKETAVTEQLLRMPPGETAIAVLPVYVREEVSPGDYQRHVRVRMVGYEEPLIELSAPLLVARGNSIAALVVIASLGSVVLAWCLAPWFWPRILRGLSVDQLTTIALLSGAHFLIAYASRFAADAFAALAGPFAVFVAGIGNEGLTSGLVAALLVLVPRVGVLTLSSLTVFLLQAMFTGQLGLVDLLMVTVSIIVQEFLLFSLGITREASTENLRDRLAPTYALRMALAIGFGNALALSAQFCLATELYRLYFATWYVVAVAVITGLIYGGLGAASGTVLGCQLRRTAR